MSLLGVSWAMGAYDDGLESAFNNTIEGFGRINSMIDEQSSLFKKSKTKDYFGEIGKGVQSAVSSFGSLDGFTGKIKDMGDTIALSAMYGADAVKKNIPVALDYMEDKFINTFSTVKMGLEDFTEKSKSTGETVALSLMYASDGVRKFAGHAKVGLGHVGGMFRKTGDRVVNLGSRMSGAFNGMRNRLDRFQNRVMQFNVASIARSLSSLTGQTGNLSNELESMGVANAKAAKPIIATMNLSAKEMQKMTSRASGMAIGLNTDAASVAETLKAIHTAGEPAKRVLAEMATSEKDWQRIVETTNMDMQTYVALAGDMVANWNMTPKQAAAVIDNMVALGKETKLGISPLKSLNGQMEEISTTFRGLPPSMQRTGDEIQQLVESGVRLGGAFKQMGKSEEEAVKAGNAAAKMFADQAAKVETLYSIGGEGRLDDESPLFKFLSQLGVGVDQAREIINVGSRDVVKGTSMIQDIVLDMGGKGTAAVDYALKGLLTGLGEGASGLEYLVASATDGKKALHDMMNVTVQGQGALKQFGKDAYSSGRTLQESYDLARQSFETTVRSIARSQVRGLVKYQMDGFKELGQEIKELGSDKTWGPWIKSVSLFDQMGMGGLALAFLDKNAGAEATKNATKMGHKIKYAMDIVGKVGDELSPIMQMLGMFGPLGPLLAGGGLAALLMVDDQTAKGILGPLYNSFKGFKDMITSLWKTYSPVMKGIWSDQIWPKIKEVYSASKEYMIGLWKEDIYPAIKKFWINDFIPFVKEKAPMVGSAILDALKWAWNELGTTHKVVVGGVITAAVLGSFSKGGMHLAAMLGPKGIAGAAFLLAVYKGADYIADRLAKAHEKIIEAEASEKKTDMGVQKLASEGYKANHQEKIEKVALEIASRRGAMEASINDFERARVIIDQAVKTTPATDLVGQVLKDREMFFELLERQGAVIRDKILLDIAIQNIRKRDLSDKEMFEAIEKVLNTSLVRGKDISSKAIQMLQKLRSAEGTAAESAVLSGIRTGGARGAGRVVTGIKTAKDAKGTTSMHVDDIIRNMDDLAIQAGMAGVSAAVEFGSGITSGMDSQIQSINESVEKGTRHIVGQSPPKEGPLSGTGFSSNVYIAGYSIMEQFAYGIGDTTDLIRNALTEVLDDALIVTLEEYTNRMAEMAEKQTFLQSIAKAMVRDLGGSITTQVDVAGETENVKASLEAALSMPGLAGVTTAIIQEGAKTRGVLGKMLTELNRQTSLLSGGSGKGGGKPPSVLP